MQNNESEAETAARVQEIYATVQRQVRWFLIATLAAIAVRLDVSSLALEPELRAALIDEPPVLRRDGGFVRDGYRKELDDNRSLRDQSRQVLAEMQAALQSETNIRSLKVRHNNILGYFIEVPAREGRSLMSPPHAERFLHRQTMVNAMRFSTRELGESEGRITSAADRALALEQEIFEELAGKVLAAGTALSELAAALAELDVHAALAEVAEEQRYTRPILDDSLAFEIVGGRHPVVEQALAASAGGPFIENDCTLGRALETATAAITRTAHAAHTSAGSLPSQDGSGHGLPGFDEGAGPRLWIVTGPNMAGKSTFLRQNALIAILAQIGSFVPARRAHLGIVDRLFSRVGASDDLARGRSTFMVEMVETAGILHQASPRSLVILDEIGRGTATFDGLSIAWATVEHLHEVNRCRALFATHYHELTALAGKLPFAANATIEVKEWKDGIVFLHKVVPGTANRSYGIQVAKLAGLPRSVIERAGEVLRLLEEEGQKASPEDLIADLPLFAAARPKSVLPSLQPEAALAPAEPAAPALPDGHAAALKALAAVNPDELTPRQALEELYRLRGLVR